MSAIVIFAIMLLSFATMLTAHVAIVIGLARRTPRYRALVALVLPPVGAVWAFRQRLHVRAIAWLVGALAYVVVRLMH